MSLFLLVGGLLLLLCGGEILVRGAGDIAQRLRLPQILIGMVIVGFGTSMPEFMVTLDAAMEGETGLAVGNVIGSNISNILLILGLSALLYTLPRPTGHLKKDATLLLAVTTGVVVLGFQGLIPVWQGAILFLLVFVYSGFEFWHSRGRAASQTGNADAVLPEGVPNLFTSLVLMAAGFAGVFLGADFFVDGAVEIANFLGVSKTFIGLSVAAVGTSLPELVTSVLAARKGNAGLAYGNIVGSNVFNILGVIGFAAMIHPLEMPQVLVRVDGPIMILSTVLMFWLFYKKGRLSRRHGAFMVTLYAVYLTFRYVLAVDLAGN